MNNFNPHKYETIKFIECGFTRIDEQSNRYDLIAKYHCTDKHGNLDEVIIRGFVMHFDDKPIFPSHSDQYLSLDCICTQLNIPESRISATVTRLITVEKEMTLEELEKVLGYKVKISDHKKGYREGREEVFDMLKYECIGYKLQRCSSKICQLENCPLLKKEVEDGQ